MNGKSQLNAFLGRRDLHIIIHVRLIHYGVSFEEKYYGYTLRIPKRAKREINTHENRNFIMFLIEHAQLSSFF